MMKSPRRDFLFGGSDDATRLFDFACNVLGERNEL